MKYLSIILLSLLLVGCNQHYKYDEIIEYNCQNGFHSDVLVLLLAEGSVNSQIR